MSDLIRQLFKWLEKLFTPPSKEEDNFLIELKDSDLIEKSHEIEHTESTSDKQTGSEEEYTIDFSKAKFLLRNKFTSINSIRYNTRIILYAIETQESTSNKIMWLPYMMISAEALMGLEFN